MGKPIAAKPSRNHGLRNPISAPPVESRGTRAVWCRAAGRLPAGSNPFPHRGAIAQLLDMIIDLPRVAGARVFRNHFHALIGLEVDQDGWPAQVWPYFFGVEYMEEDDFITVVPQKWWTSREIEEIVQAMGPRAEPALLDLLASDTPRAQTFALRMLAKVGTEKGLPDLRRLQAEGDRRSRRAGPERGEGYREEARIAAEHPPEHDPGGPSQESPQHRTEEGGGRRLIVAGAAAWRTESVYEKPAIETLSGIL